MARKKAAAAEPQQEQPDPATDPSQTPATSTPGGENDDQPDTAPDSPAAPKPDEPDAPAEPSQSAEPAGTEAAPLASPPPRGLGNAPSVPTVPPAISAVMGERHMGIVDAKGKPIDDLEAVLVKDTPQGTSRRAMTRILEETTVPGNHVPGQERTRRRLLYGEGQVIPEVEIQALLAAVAERRNAEQPA
jgi:hypothetical protein